MYSTDLKISRKTPLLKVQIPLNIRALEFLNLFKVTLQWEVPEVSRYETVSGDLYRPQR